MISILDIKSGSESCFTFVFNKLHTRLYYYFYKKTRSAEMARELVQLTFIKLWQFKHTLSEDHSFDVQLFRIACSTLIDYLRSQQAIRKNVVTLAGSTDTMIEELPMQPENNFEDADYLNAVIRSLSPTRKKVFILSRVHGHSYKEIAKELSISVKTVEDHMVKALRHIRAVVLQSFFFLPLFIWLY